MPKFGKALIESYFRNQSFVDCDIESFNNLIDKELNGIIEENKEIEPTIIPQNIDTFIDFCLGIPNNRIVLL